MYIFGKESKAVLQSVHPLLRLLAHKAILKHDFAVREGYRAEQAQHKAFLDKRSKVDWPNSKHNKFPSHAVHFLPIVNGRMIVDVATTIDIAQWSYFLGIVHALADDLRIPVRFGINWDMDAEILSDQTFNDWAHIELTGGELI